MNYSKEYFLNECEGFKSFSSSRGLNLSKRLLSVYKKAYVLKPKKVLDFGSGRGELALNLALSDFETYGVDSSKDAIELSEGIKKYWIKNSPQMKLEFILLKEKKLPFNDETFDLIIFSDVVEHIDKEELLFWYKESYRVLNKNGHILIHTSPNKIFIKWGLRLYWFLAFFNKIKLPWDMKKNLPEGLQNNYHINEQTGFSLKKDLKKSNFKNIKIEFWKNPHYVYYFLKEDKYIKKLNYIYKFLPIKQLFFADLFALAEKLS